MSVSNYTYELQSIVLYKFGALVSGIKTIPDMKTSIDISLQVHEVSIFQSLFSQYLKCELAVVDGIGLLFNFPVSGEEAVEIKYKNIVDDQVVTLYMVVDSIDSISVSPDTRTMAYMINCISIECYANNKQTVQQAYHDTTPNIVKKVFNDHIVSRIQQVFPQYIPQPLFVENNDLQSQTVVIPNIHPFAAMSMLAEMSGETSKKFTYLIYQTTSMYNFRTLQGLFNPATPSRRKAKKNNYIYMSNQFTDGSSSKLQNEGRVVAKLTINQRLSSFGKLSMGYYHNNLFEINIAQKNVWGQPTRTEDIPTIYPNQLNTATYSQLAVIEGDDEQSNRTKYVVSTQRENDDQYPVSKMRDKWGKDLIASNAMSQIDLTVTIPGTSLFTVGDLFYLEIPESHGFNEVQEDQLISGYFLISECKHMLHQGGQHTTVLGLNRDSYNSSIDRESRFAKQ
jgi:hypothetical protein